MRTDPKQSDENREEAELEEALKLWMEIRQADRKKGWERLEAEIGRQYGLRRQERRDRKSTRLNSSHPSSSRMPSSA